MAAASKTDLEGDLDRLYQLPLSEFTSARDELVKRLRAQGESERAQEIKKLRKPPAAVWVVNQLARERPLDVQRLLKAGESLTKSQAKAAAGKSPQTFTEARRAEQRALEQLAKGAIEIAERAGIGSSAIGKAAETLRAASLTAEGRELLKRGRLTEELEPPGFEALTGLEGLGRQVAPAKPESAAERRPGRETTGTKASAGTRPSAARRRARTRYCGAGRSAGSRASRSGGGDSAESSRPCSREGAGDDRSTRSCGSRPRPARVVGARWGSKTRCRTPAGNGAAGTRADRRS